MEERKYKKRLLTGEASTQADPSLRKNYEKEQKEELVVQRSSVLKLTNIYTAAMKAVMTGFAFIGAISLLRPELRLILFKIAAEAIREIKGF